MLLAQQNPTIARVGRHCCCVPLRGRPGQFHRGQRGCLLDGPKPSCLSSLRCPLQTRSDLRDTAVHTLMRAGRQNCWPDEDNPTERRDLCSGDNLLRRVCNTSDELQEVLLYAGASIDGQQPGLQ